MKITQTYNNGELIFYFFEDLNTILIEKCSIPLKELNHNVNVILVSKGLDPVVKLIVALGKNYAFSQDSTYNISEIELHKDSLFIKGDESLLFETLHHYFKIMYGIDPFDNFSFLKLTDDVNQSSSVRSDFLAFF